MISSPKKDRLLAAALDRYSKLALQECFDPSIPTSRPTLAQMEVLKDVSEIHHRYVTAGNQSGKSQLGAREVSWFFMGNHPYFENPWNEPLLILVLGRTTKQIEDTLWRKIKSFLVPGTYKEQRVGGTLQRVVNLENDNVIIFLSHHNAREAREKAQSFVAMHVWLDELPSDIRLLEELHRRIQAKNGRLLCTFTPKAVTPQIKKLVDSSVAPLAKKYKFSMLDNPIYDEVKRNQILQSLATYSPGYQKTILEGDWLTGERSVYHFDYDTMVEAPGEPYSPAWRHVESIDPAISSECGYTLWAEDPNTGIWYCIKDDYLDSTDPEDLLNKVQKTSEGYNIVRRICDPHEVWFITLAARRGLHYICPYDKNSRKSELIKNFQMALGTLIRIAPWCINVQDEIVSCQWSETAEGKIANGSKYHELDTCQYFVDCKPKGAPVAPVYSSWGQWLRAESQKTREREYRAGKLNPRVRVKKRSLLWA